jgi:hypothetical protein
MTYFPDLCCMTMIESGSRIRAIGWLSSDHDYPKARPAPEFIRRLQRLCDTWHASQAVFGFHLLLGYHICEFCGTCKTFGNIRIPGDRVLYVAPEMVAHYCAIHDYAPPAEFIQAVLMCPDFTEPAYAALVSPLISRRSLL